MSVSVGGQISGRDFAAVAAEIGRRLIALEKAVRGAAGDSYVSPEATPFGPGASTGGGTTTVVNNITGVTDHGALTGLVDDDHPQYALHGQEKAPHVHGPDDVPGLEQRFPRRLERTPPTPHIHPAQDISGLPFEGQRIEPRPHQHVMADVADLRPDDVQFVLASRMFGRV